MTKAPRKQTDNHWERDKKNNDKAAKTASLRRFTARDNSGFHRSRSVKLFIDKQLIRNQGLSAVKTGFWTELNWNMGVGTMQDETWHFGRHFFFKVVCGRRQ